MIKNDFNFYVIHKGLLHTSHSHSLNKFHMNLVHNDKKKCPCNAFIDCSMRHPETFI